MKESFGHLLIDLVPKTFAYLRYCSNITEPAPTVFYLPSFEAEAPPLNDDKEINIYTEANCAFATKTVEEIRA